ncbi:MAG: hypothetical protein R2724_19095 [Bryobacterales bacterium]
MRGQKHRAGVHQRTDGQVFGEGGAPLEGVKVSSSTPRSSPTAPCSKPKPTKKDATPSTFATGSYRIRVNPGGPSAEQPWDPAEVAGAPSTSVLPPNSEAKTSISGAPYPVRSIDIRIIDAAGAWPKASRPAATR